MRTESGVQGVCPTHSALLHVYCLEKIFLSVGVQLLWVLPEHQEAHSHFTFASTVLKGIWRKMIKKENPPFTAQMCSGCMPLLCSRKDTPFLSPSCWPSWQEKVFHSVEICCQWLLPHLPAAKDSEWPGGHKRKMAESCSNTLASVREETSDTTQLPTLVGSRQGLGNTFAGAKMETYALAVLKKEKTPIHTTTFQEREDAACLRYRQRQSASAVLLLPAGPWMLRSSDGWPLLCPHTNTTSQGMSECVAKIMSF